MCFPLDESSDRVIISLFDRNTIFLNVMSMNMELCMELCDLFGRRK